MFSCTVIYTPTQQEKCRVYQNPSPHNSKEKVQLRASTTGGHPFCCLSVLCNGTCQLTRKSATLTHQQCYHEQHYPRPGNNTPLLSYETTTKKESARETAFPTRQQLCKRATLWPDYYEMTNHWVLTCISAYPPSKCCYLLSRKR